MARYKFWFEMNKHGIIDVNAEIPVSFPLELQKTLGRDFMEVIFHHTFGKFELYGNYATGKPILFIKTIDIILDGIERTAEQAFTPYNERHPAKGGYKRDPFFRHPSAPAKMRQAYSDLCNYHLEVNGYAERVIIVQGN
jgi:hypothetical protein